MKKNYPVYQLIIILILFAFFLVACSSEKDNAAQAIEAYINALGNQDAVQISNLSCADWEQNALIEVDSLTSVGSKVENLECRENGQEGNSTFVSCTGIISLDYNGEAQQIDLSNRTYIARMEGDEWRMCGYR